MNASRLCMLASLEQQLREFLPTHPLGHERAAAVLFRRLSVKVPGLPDSDRYIAAEVHPFPEEWVVSSSPTHVRYELHHLRELFRRCEEDGLVFGFAHSHPAGAAGFSTQDDENEQTLITAISNRNGPEVHMVAMVLCDGQWLSRIHQKGSQPIDVRHVAVVGDRIALHAYTRSKSPLTDDVTSRQEAAFGRPFVDMLRSLRVGVVGCSGTGSPTATLLARAGVGELILVDKDRLEDSNLNRVRGFKRKDVGEHKAKVLQQYIHDLGLSVAVAAYETLADSDPATLDALSSCDVVFGCTDDEIGREALNAACYFYALPYIDIGLGGVVAPDAEGNAKLRSHFGRLSVVLPEAGECLFCQGVISERGIARENALRQEPELTEDQLKERYLDGGGEQAPGVGPFTNAVADFAAATLFDLLRPYRRYPPELRRDLLNVDFVNLEFRSPGYKQDAECEYCSKHTFLLKKTKYRLGRPALGQANVYL